MCAIIDANVAGEVFGPSPQQAAKKFYDWINKGSGRLVAGGKLLQELESGSQRFNRWAAEAVKFGMMRIVNEAEINTRTVRLKNQGVYVSDDPHILALAQVSGARLLYSNDSALHEDFTNKELVDKPRGKIYSTLRTKNFSRSHRQMLNKGDLCRKV